MLVMWAAEDPTGPLGEFVSAQETLRLDHLPFAMDPLGLYGIQPWTLLWQQAAYDSHSFAAALDTAVVRTEPTPELFGDMQGFGTPCHPLAAGGFSGTEVVGVYSERCTTFGTSTSGRRLGRVIQAPKHCFSRCWMLIGPKLSATPKGGSCGGKKGNPAQ
jgi:hypothetical protein